MTFQECKADANRALGTISFRQRQAWWTSPHPKLEGGEPYMAIFEESLRPLIVEAARDGVLTP